SSFRANGQAKTSPVGSRETINQDRLDSIASQSYTDSQTLPNSTLTKTMSTVRMKRGVPEGLWIRCPQCKATIFRKEAESRLNVCPECEYHFYLPARERIKQLVDEESFEEWLTELIPKDPLQFNDRILYSQRLKAEQTKTG